MVMLRYSEASRFAVAFFENHRLPFLAAPPHDLADERSALSPKETKDVLRPEDMRTHEGQIDYSIDPPSYPKWWDYFNGAIVAVMMLGTATALLLWMIHATLSRLN
jgi:hypothetical protein